MQQIQRRGQRFSIFHAYQQSILYKPNKQVKHVCECHICSNFHGTKFSQIATFVIIFLLIFCKNIAD